MNRFRHFADGEKSTSHEFTFLFGNRSVVSGAVLKGMY